MSSIVFFQSLSSFLDCYCLTLPLQISIDELNDSRYIGICLYNVVVMSALCMAMSLVLEHEVTQLYGFTSGFIILGTTITQLIVFIPKVRTL